MKPSWTSARFGDVLLSVSRPEQVAADRMYRTLGVQWYAKGLFVREEKPGHDIRATELYRVELGDFVYNRLFAWKGSFGIVDSDTTGGYVSGEFPCFRVSADKAEAKYLHYYLSQERVWADIERNSSGQTNVSRLRLKEPDFLKMEIPLPPLAEQQRIVARIEALARRVEEARGLRAQAVEEAEAILKSTRVEIFAELDLEKFGKPLSDIATFLDGKRIPLNAQQRKEKQPGDVPYYGASGIVDYINEWLFDETLLLISEDGANIELRSKPIAFVIQGKSWVNNHAHVLRLPDETTAVFLRHYIEGLDVRPFWQGATRPKINKSTLEAIPIPDVPLSEQHRIVAYLDGLQARVDELKRLQAETQKELDALMPSILAKAFAGEL
jgi:type I restriction enzyme S subunit